MSEEAAPSVGGSKVLGDQESFTLEAGRRMTLRDRLLWLEEMHLLVLRWSEKRRMIYPDGTEIGPGTSRGLPAVAEAPGDYGKSAGGDPSS